jgi:hypothetical protein
MSPLSFDVLRTLGKATDMQKCIPATSTSSSSPNSDTYPLTLPNNEAAPNEEVAGEQQEYLGDDALEQQLMPGEHSHEPDSHPSRSAKKKRKTIHKLNTLQIGYM